MNAAVLVLALLAGPASSAAPPEVVQVQADDPPPPLPGEENEPLDEPPALPSEEAAPDGPKASSAATADDVGFVERFFPFTFNEDLHPDVKDNQLMFFLGGLLGAVAGQVWLPDMVMKGDTPDGYFGDALLIWAAHAGVHCVPFCLLPCVFVPVVNFVMGPVVSLLFAGNFFCCLINNYYLTPVAIANEYDRKLKAQGTPPSKPTGALPPDAPTVAAAMAF